MLRRFGRYVTEGVSSHVERSKAAKSDPPDSLTKQPSRFVLRAVNFELGGSCWAKSRRIDPGTGCRLCGMRRVSLYITTKTINRYVKIYCYRVNPCFICATIRRLGCK